MSATVRFAGLNRTPLLCGLAVVMLVCTAPLAHASSYLEQGETALRNNQPDHAKALLEAFLNQNPGDEKATLYLGIAELQLGEFTQAVDTLKQGLSGATTLKDIFYFDIGNIYFMQGQNTLAEGMYSMAIHTNPNLAEAYLNRANARMKLDSYDGAVSDYTAYLSIRPNAPQRPEIEKLIGLLKRAKSQAAQQAQLAAEKKKQEEARQQALLDSVLQSLDSASNNTKNLQAGNASIQDTKTNLGLAD